MRITWWTVILLAACGGEDSSPSLDAAVELDAGVDADVEVDAGPPIACGLIDAIAVDGEPIPGHDVTLQAQDAGSGRAYEVDWSVPSGTLAATTGPAVGWTLDGAMALHTDAVVTITAVAHAPGCLDETQTLDVTVGWPDRLRTIVLYNTEVVGSEDVAVYYATFRGIPDQNLCAMTYADSTTVAGSDYPALLQTVMDCIATAGDQVHVIVPVWGVPYKVSDRVHDFGADGHPFTTICLDALLFFGNASLDVHEAGLNPIYQNGDSLNDTYDDWRPFGEFRELIGYDYYLVTRIDGADADAARDLVDRTVAAETLAQSGSLAGTVYVDGNRGLPHPATDSFGTYESGEWNMVGVENVFTALGTYPVVADYNGEEFGTAPAPLTCPDALYYAGWYSFGNYNDVFTWNPGAIGGHLDSCSACDIRGDVDWSARALRRGITATFGAVNEPYVNGMPEYDQFFLYLTHGASFGEAAYESTILGPWMMVWVGDPLYRPYR
jgi:uncharacterized protein (TIGR03790 family)